MLVLGASVAGQWVSCQFVANLLRNQRLEAARGEAA